MESNLTQKFIIIDKQHDKFLNELEYLVDNFHSLPETEIVKDLLNIYDDVISHFSLEEEIMIRTNHHHLDAHISSHIVNRSYFKIVISFPTIENLRKLILDIRDHISVFDSVLLKDISKLPA